MREDWGYYVVIPIICLIVVLFLKDKVQVRLSKMKQISSKTKEDKETELQQRLLKILLPQLETIQEKLNQQNIVWTDDSGHISFDQELLFDEINVDKSEEVSFNELNTVLDLKPGQLLEFIAFINELAGVPKTEECVTKPVFLQFFLEAFEHARNFEPSDEQAGHTFDRIVQDLGFPDDNAIDIEDLYQSHLSNFLNESQINMLKGKFQRVLDILSGTNNSRSKQSSILVDNPVTSTFSKRLSDAMQFSYGRRQSSLESSQRYSVGRSSDQRRSTILSLEQEVINREGLTKSERVFCQCMFEVLQYSELFDPKVQDINQITYEILDDLEFFNSGEVDTESLPEKLSEFLDEDQLNILRRKYQKVINLTNNEETDVETIKWTEKSLRRMSQILKRERSKELTKHLFCQFYSTFLIEIKQIEKLQMISKRDTITLAFENLSLSVNVKDEPKYILNGVTGIVKGKAMTAILVREYRHAVCDI